MGTTEPTTATAGSETLALHAGRSPDATTGARAVPIYRTTPNAFRGTDHAANLLG